METDHLIPDAPFRSGVTGKYKLLIESVTPSFSNFEYELVDAEGKEYKAVSEVHYAKDQLLRCMVSFEVKNARFVVSGIAICKKQDLATPIPEAKSARSKATPKPSLTILTPKPAKKPKPKPKTLFVLIDELQDNGQKTGPMSDGEIQNLLKQIEQRKNTNKGSYRCCGQTHHGLFEFRKHLFECHPEEYTKHFVSELHRDAPSVIRGVGVMTSRSPKRNTGPREAYLKRSEGDRFHLIYTPMGNKR